MNKGSKTLKRVVKFCLSGGAGVITYYVSLYLLTEIAHVWYVSSAVISFVLNNAINFLLQKLWTFEDNNTKTVHIQAAKYVSMGILFLGLNTTTLYVLVDWIHIQLYPAQVFLTLLLSILSYFITSKIFSK